MFFCNKNSTVKKNCLLKSTPEILEYGLLKNNIRKSGTQNKKVHLLSNRKAHISNVLQT